MIHQNQTPRFKHFCLLNIILKHLWELRFYILKSDRNCKKYDQILYIMGSNIISTIFENKIYYYLLKSTVSQNFCTEKYNSMFSYNYSTL